MGKNTWAALCIAVTALGACAQNTNRPTASVTSLVAPESTEMAVSSVTMPPSGYLDYCVRNPGECPSAGRSATQREPLSAARWAQLNHVNTFVNSSVRYVPDSTLYRQSEYWTYPNGRGDCEDFVLAKRKLLLDHGWRAETLLIGVALDLEGLRHAVLIAATDKGDFILDNQLENVVAWSETGYTWEKRQTAANPNIWVSLTGEAAAPSPFDGQVSFPVQIAQAQESPSTAANNSTTLAEGHGMTEPNENEHLLLSPTEMASAHVTIKLPLSRPKTTLLTSLPSDLNNHPDPDSITTGS